MYAYTKKHSWVLFAICRFAPIRGLLQKREYLQSLGHKLGPAYLVFGSRSTKEGLFQDEISEYINQRVLTKGYMCYSQEPGQKKEYTSAKLRSARVKAILSPIMMTRPNLHVFICGSANMAGEKLYAFYLIIQWLQTMTNANMHVSFLKYLQRKASWLSLTSHLRNACKASQLMGGCTLMYLVLFLKRGPVTTEAWANRSSWATQSGERLGYFSFVRRHDNEFSKVH